MDRFKVTIHCNGYESHYKTFYYKEQALKFMEDQTKIVRYNGGTMTLEEMQWNVIDFFVSNS